MSPKYNKINFILLVFILVAFLGCAPTQLVMTDMNNYLKNQEEYDGKYVVFITELEELIEKPELFKDKMVQITGTITYVGDMGFPRWNIILEKNGKKILAYEDDYRTIIRGDVLTILRKAKHEKGEVVVRGKLKSNGIELKQVVYKEYVLYTDYPQAEQYIRYWSSRYNDLYFQNQLYIKPTFPKFAPRTNKK